MVKVVGWACAIAAIGLSLFHIYTGIMGNFTPMLQRGIHIFIILFLAFSLYSFKGKQIRWYNIVLLSVTLILALATLPLFSPEAQFDRGVIGPSQMEIVQGWVLLVLILIATKFVLGWAMTIIASIFIVYAFIGPYLPGILYHTGVSPASLSSNLIWTTEGVFGTPLGVAATFVALFILFGVLLEETGAGEFFIDLSYAVAGRFRGGPAQTAVVSSALMGSIQGSSVSNVVSTGNFTIPLMKKTGYSKEVAGGIEAVASTGGQIVPPVMGAVAFVMADMTGLGYAAIVLAAVIPAFLFYIALSSAVYFEAKKAGLEKKHKSELPNISATLKNGFYLFAPLIVLIYCLVILELSPSFSALITIVATFLILIVQNVLKERALPIKSTYNVLKKGAEILVPVSVACATAGVLIGIFGATGLGIRFSQGLIDLSGGMLVPALLLMMLACIILGMGLPTTAAYIITAVLGAQALVSLGVPLLAAHMFILYFAIMSFITPPVALSAFAAAGIANGDALRTSVSAWRLGLSGYIIPFMFVFNPSLLGEGSLLEITTALIPATIGVVSLSISTTGWFLERMNGLERVVMFGIAILFLVPNLAMTAVAAVLLLAIILYQLRKRNVVLGSSSQVSS
ncbi:TRAP transporter permease [Geomicrobium sp. JSM 1781026]|uniref:TRAP transporter permease n=1 Tax=Geomicrobium sp. JSM 1781026 TaxID=3344580 RepID=UPI0035BF3789